MSEQDEKDYAALAKEHGGSPVIDYKALAAEHGGTAAAAPTDYAALAKEHGGKAAAEPSHLDADTQAAVSRLSANPVEGTEFHAAPSTWQRFTKAVEHPIDYLGEVEEDTQKGGGRTIVGRTLGHMQARGDEGYQADQSGLAPIMAGPLQGPPKIVRGALRIAAPPDPNKTVEQNVREDVGGFNEMTEGTMQTPGAAIGVLDPEALPKLIMGGTVGTVTNKGLKSIGVPNEYAELGGNAAGLIAAADPERVVRTVAKTADVIPGSVVRGGLKKILPVRQKRLTSMCMFRVELLD